MCYVVFCYHRHLDPKVLVHIVDYNANKIYNWFLTKNPSFRSYRVICLPQISPTIPEAQDTEITVHSSYGDSWYKN